MNEYSYNICINSKCGLKGEGDPISIVCIYESSEVRSSEVDFFQSKLRFSTISPLNVKIWIHLSMGFEKILFNFERHICVYSHKRIYPRTLTYKWQYFWVLHHYYFAKRPSP